jgi:hypothetical protein
MGELGLLGGQGSEFPGRDISLTHIQQQFKAMVVLASAA